MYQFKVRATEYNESGALTSVYHDYSYADVDSAKCQYDELKREYYTDVDGNKTSIKKYSVSLYVSTYKKVDDVDKFFAQFYF